jgi:hypothetical protein
MQPYFFPYIGYFQLIAAVDRFIVYDNIKYTKKGWINRNRMLQGGRDVTFSLPLKHDSDSLCVCERELAANFDRDKLLRQFSGAYRRARFFEQSFPLIEQIVRHEESNLFRFLHNSIIRTCEHFGIGTKIMVSSTIAIDHGLKSQDKVLALCNVTGARTYVNNIGGMELYVRKAFQERGIELKFLRAKPFEYVQFDGKFVPQLSIIDVMMFNSLESIRGWINTHHELI